jgi:hypothetical protein
MLNHIFYGFGHKHIYDLDELTAAAELAGWSKDKGCEVRRASHRQSDVDPDLALLDDEIHQDESMYVDLFCVRS